MVKTLKRRFIITAGLGLGFSAVLVAFSGHSPLASSDATPETSQTNEAASSESAPPRLSIFVDCAVGEDCFVQNYVDIKRGKGQQSDYQCGSLTYDEHKGVDIALMNLNAMQAGYDVIAAAPGTVSGVRDGEPDIDVRTIGRGAIAGKECGNGVVIDHGNGWETRYCHLLRGSLVVGEGDTVERGAPLGQVGLSGLTEFPHAHLSLHHNGQLIDPFLGLQPDKECNITSATPLWRAEDLPKLAYHGGGLINAGFADRPPKLADIEQGVEAPAHLVPRAPALVFWVYVYGIQKGDKREVTITDPNGETFFSQTEMVTKTRARQMWFQGKRRRGQTWPEGEYTASFKLFRPNADGAFTEPLINTEKTVIVSATPPVAN